MVKKIDTSEKEYRKIRKARVFVKNIPFDVDSEKIEKIFKKIGEVDSINFPKKKNKSELKGYGFVQYKHKNIALKAIKELNKRLLGGREIEVSLAVPKKLYEQTNPKSKKNSDVKKPESEPKPEIENDSKIDADEEDPEDKPKEETKIAKKDNVSKHEKKKKKRERYKENLKLRKGNLKEKVQSVQEAREINEESKADQDFSKSTEEESANNQDFSNIGKANDLTRTIFIQNINYSTTEIGLKDFFNKFGKVVYAKICKSNGVSKGTGFVMFKEMETLEKIISLFEDSAESPLFPFELDGKKLNIYRSYDKNDPSQIPNKRPDRRNREYLLFGLYNMNEFSTEVSQQDKEKREYLMKEKKESFKNNPNLFTSSTRICIRNFSKKITEEELKDLVNSHLDQWVESQSEEIKENYAKQKKMKQFKLLRNNDEEKKSKVLILI